MITRTCINCKKEVYLTAGSFHGHHDWQSKNYDYLSFFDCPACKTRSLNIRMFNREKRTAEFDLTSYNIAIEETEKNLRQELPADIKSKLEGYLEELTTEREEKLLLCKVKI